MKDRNHQTAARHVRAAQQSLHDAHIELGNDCPAYDPLIAASLQVYAISRILEEEL